MERATNEDFLTLIQAHGDAFEEVIAVMMVYEYWLDQIAKQPVQAAVLRQHREAVVSGLKESVRHHAGNKEWADDDEALMQATISLLYHESSDELAEIVEEREG